MRKGLNLGAGPIHLDSDSFCEWENSDFAQTESAQGWSLEKLRDFTKPFTDLEDNSIDFIVAWHIIEHVGLHENAAIIKEWNRVLKPGGSLFIACPDLSKIAKHIVDRDGPWQDWFICMVNVFGPYNGFVGDYHKWGYNVESLSKLLQENGFSSVDELKREELFQAIGVNNANKIGFADYNVQLEGVK